MLVIGSKKIIFCVCWAESVYGGADGIFLSGSPRAGKGTDEAGVANTQGSGWQVLVCFGDTPRTGEEGPMRSKMAAHRCPDVQTQRGRRGSQKWGVVTAGRPGAPRLTPPGPCSRFHVCH